MLWTSTLPVRIGDSLARSIKSPLIIVSEELMALPIEVYVLYFNFIACG
jgi:hypothetical protein